MCSCFSENFRKFLISGSHQNKMLKKPSTEIPFHVNYYLLLEVIPDKYPIRILFPKKRRKKSDWLKTDTCRQNPKKWKWALGNNIAIIVVYSSRILCKSPQISIVCILLLRRVNTDLIIRFAVSKPNNHRFPQQTI